MKEEEQDDKQVEHEEEEILKKSWFDFYVHPQQLEDHVSSRCFLMITVYLTLISLRNSKRIQS